MSVRPTAEMKGTVLTTAFKVLDGLCGAGSTAKVLALEAADGKLPAIQYDEILMSAWYPAAWYGRFLRRAQETFKEEVDLPMRVGHACVSEDFRGVYKALVRALSPAMILGWAPRSFGQYYRGGTMEVHMVRAGEWRVKYDSWNGFDARIWAAVRGGSIAALEACGAQEVTGILKAGGAEHGAEMLFWWRTK